MNDSEKKEFGGIISNLNGTLLSSSSFGFEMYSPHRMWRLSLIAIVEISTSRISIAFL